MLKISENHIEKIFEIIVDNKNAVVQGAFMITLQAMAKVIKLIIMNDILYESSCFTNL